MQTSTSRLWSGRTVSGFVVLFLAFDAVMKFAKPAPVVDAFAQLGWPISTAVPIGAILLLSTALYLFPGTAILGPVVLTGYLGGAVAANFRVGNPLSTHILFPVYFGVLLWAGLFLRDRRPPEFFFLRVKA